MKSRESLWNTFWGLPTVFLIIAVGCAGNDELTRDEIPTTRVSVIDTDGEPIAGADVYWHTAGNPRFICSVAEDPLRHGYVRAGEGKTGDDGAVAIGEGVHRSRAPLTFQVLASDGRRTLGSVPVGGDATVTVRNTVHFELEPSCQDVPCDEVEVSGGVAHRGGECAIASSDLQDDRLGPIQVPRGTLELRVRANRGTPSESVRTLELTLREDTRMSLELRRIGGNHALSGEVVFPDGEAPGGRDYFTSVRLDCDNGLMRTVTADPSTGGFSFDALPDDSCEVSASHSGTREGKWTAVRANVRPASTETLQLTLEQTSSQ